MKSYERRIRLIDQHMYAAWRIGVDELVLRKMLRTHTAIAVTLTAMTRDFAAACARMMKVLEPVIAEARREQSVGDAIARRQEFDL